MPKSFWYKNTALNLWLNISPESQNPYSWKSHNSLPNHYQSTQLSISHKRGEQQFIKLLILNHRYWIPEETKFQNPAPFCSLIRGCCLSKLNIAQLYRPGVLSADAQPVAKAVPIALELPREWLMLPPQETKNSITDPHGLDGTVGPILSNLQLQPGSDSADQVAQAFFPSWVLKNSTYVACPAPLAHC